MHLRLALKLMLPLLLCSALVSSWSAAAADAATEPWGEITHFADKPGELENTQPAFGVNPEDGSAWVGDETSSGELRIQRFKNEGGSWVRRGSDEFEIAEHNGNNLTIKGIAFDKELHRAYVMVEEERPAGKGEEESEEMAAAQLWEFTTNEESAITGKVLVERSEGAYKGPVGESSFDPQAASSKASHLVLNEPSGIAVDQKNHEILITGWVGPGSKPVASMWAISENGKITEDWEDGSGKSQFFEEGSELNSPVVTSTGQILVLGNGGERTEGSEQVYNAEQIYEMPTSLNSKAAPKPVYTEPGLLYCKYADEGSKKCPFIETLTEFFPGQNGNLSYGSRMAIGPEGDIYVHIQVANASAEGSEEGGVMVLTPQFEELGWTGGGSWATASKSCAVNETSGGVSSLIAASSQGVFMFEPGVAGHPGGNVRILELGAKGSTGGCPLPSARLEAKAGGVSVEGIPVPIADPVTFETSLVQANAVKTIWEVEPGVIKEKQREQRNTKFEYKFAKAGTFDVKETIYTDDLAMPTLTKEVKVEVVNEGEPVVHTESATGVTSSEATLNAKVDPAGFATSCEFKYAATASYTASVPCASSPGSGTSAVAVTAALSNLEPSKTYHFAVVATNSKGVKQGADQTFTTSPVAATQAAEAISQTGATLKAVVDPRGGKTSACSFEYGTGTSYGTTIPCSAALGTGHALVGESAAVSGLAAGTTYHFRVVANGSSGETFTGEDKTFVTVSAACATCVVTTPPPPPPPPPGREVLHEGLVHEASPVVSVSGVALTVAANGSFSLKLSCPGGETQCSGTVTLKTLSAVAASARAAKAKKTILTLASASFTIAGGKLKAITLHLSAKAKALIAKLHMVRARATIVARNPQGATHTGSAILTLKSAKKKH